MNCNKKLIPRALNDIISWNDVVRDIMKNGKNAAIISYSHEHSEKIDFSPLNSIVEIAE